MSLSTGLGERVSNTFELRTGFNGWLMIPVVAGIILLIISFSLYSDSNAVDTGVIVTAALGVLTTLLPIALGIVLRKRFGVDVFENGISVSGKAGKKDVLFENVFALQVDNKTKYANGEAVGTDVKVNIWTSRDTQRPPAVGFLGMANVKKADYGDFDVGFDHLLSQITDVLANRLESGEVLAGGGFEMNSNGIRTGLKSIAYDAVGMAGCFDDEICIWEKKQEMPSLRIKPGKINALPLLGILTRKLETAEKENYEIPGLGRILFHRGKGVLLKAVLCVLTLCAIGPAAFSIVAMFKEPTVGIVAFAIFAPMFAVLLCGTINSFMYKFRCHEKGIAVKGLLGLKNLTYSDVSSFTYSATRQYLNGAYAGTVLNMKFVPIPGAGKTLKYTTTVKNESGDLDQLRDHISRVMAGRFLERIKAGDLLKWGECQLSEEGIRFRKRKLIGKGDEMLLPFDQVLGWDISDGVFHLFQKDQDKSVIDMPVGLDNFFPLYLTFSALCSGDEEMPDVSADGTDAES